MFSLAPGPRLRARRAALALFTALLGLLPVPGRTAEDDAAQTRAAIDSFVQASVSIEQGNAAAAMQGLERMATAVQTLRGTAERQRTLAQAQAQACQARSVAVVNAIAEAYDEQRRKEADLNELQAQWQGLEARQQALTVQMNAVESQWAGIREEARERQRCASDGWYAFKTGACWRMSFQDLFENRYQHLNDQQADLARQQRENLDTRGRLQQDRTQRGNEIAATQRRIGELEARRRELEVTDRAARAAAVNLSDIALFWTQADNTIRQRLSGGISMLSDLVRMLDQAPAAPAFDNSDQRDVRSLRERMLAISQGVDGGNRFLTTELACR